MRADRLLSMTILLQTRGKMTAKALAEELGVSERTVLRDVEALSIGGVPVYAEGGHGGGIMLDKQYRTSLTGLRENEVRALFITRSHEVLTDIGLNEAAESTLLKLLAALPSLHHDEVMRMQQRILLDSLWWFRGANSLALLDRLRTAVFEDRRVHVTYERGDGTLSDRVIDPYSLVAKSSTWYVVALHGEEFRTFKVDRFHNVELLDDHFIRRDSFDLTAYWRESNARFEAASERFAFTLVLAPECMQFLKTYAEGRFNVVGQADDGWLEVQITLGSLEAARMLTLGLGTQARIIEPDELTASVTKSVQALVSHYHAG